MEIEMHLEFINIIPHQRNPQTVTVVVRNLPPATTSDQLRSICNDFGEVVEVEIPQKAGNFLHFIYGFVRYSSLEVALNAVLKLNTLVVQGRQLNAEVARKHWRNTNDKTVLYDAPHEAKEDERDEDDLEEEELNTRILQLCHQQCSNIAGVTGREVSQVSTRSWTC
nr:RNA-binding protein 28-like [Penaeus vannamei]